MYPRAIQFLPSTLLWISYFHLSNQMRFSICLPLGHIKHMLCPVVSMFPLVWPPLHPYNCLIQIWRVFTLRRSHQTDKVHASRPCETRWS